MPRKLAAFLAFLVIVGIGIVWLMGGLKSEFRQVQAVMQAKPYVTCRETWDSDPSVRLMILSDGRSRIERPDASYIIADTNKNRRLFVNPEKQKARLERWVRPNVYELIRDLQYDLSVHSLPTKVLDGRDVVGFHGSILGEYDVSIWADASSKLPVRIEAKGMGKDMHAGLMVIDEFDFDQEVDGSLFELEPPAGYKLMSQSIPSGAPAAIPPSPPRFITTAVLTGPTAPSTV